jgi:hypothetical protein
LCDTDAQRDSALLADYLALLDADESERLQRLVFERDRHRFLVSHALLRSVLSLYGGQPAGSWRFLKGRHGKPELVPVQRERAPAFNLSHSDRWRCLRSAPGRSARRRHRVPSTDATFGPRDAQFRPVGCAVARSEGADLAGEFYDLYAQGSLVKTCGDRLTRSLADSGSTDRPAASLCFERSRRSSRAVLVFLVARLEGSSAALALFRHRLRAR